jgi:HPt (histidine-containing phosphotransfer) domain-containing protein
MSTEQHDPIFDPQVIRGMLEMFGDPAPVVKVIRLFLEEAPRQVDAVVEGLSRGEAEEVRRSAHSLKSSAASLGARDLSERSAKIEELTRAGRIDDVHPLLEPLRGSLQKTSASLAGEAERLDRSSAGGSFASPAME